MLSFMTKLYRSRDDLTNLPCLTIAIKESMRLHSPVPAISRRLTKPMTIEGVTLLPGTSVVMSLALLHHNTAVWGEDAMEYRPERFLGYGTIIVHRQAAAQKIYDACFFFNYMYDFTVLLD